MDIRLNAEVKCAEGLCGHCVGFIVDPISDKVTHLVVKETTGLETERLVPLSHVQEGTPELISLACSWEEFRTMKPFIETEFIPGGLAEPSMASSVVWPYSSPESPYLIMEHERIPLDELAIHRGAHVHATDGRVGQVDEFVVEPQSGSITHLVLREGHLWGQKDVTIAVSQIDQINDDEVYLKLSKQEIKALPSIPLRRGKG